MKVVLLDAGPLGLITNPKHSPRSTACARWLQSLAAGGVRVIVPEIADYEVRRELLRADKKMGVAQLDQLGDRLEFLPITTSAMRKAAEFWAEARQRGQPTASDKAIDGDSSWLPRRRRWRRPKSWLRQPTSAISLDSSRRRCGRT